MRCKFFPFLLLLFLISPASAFAHQPRLVSETPIAVPDPEISKAYYGELTGEPHIFRITADKPFALYLNILEPDIEDQGKNSSVMAIQAHSSDSKPYAFLDGGNFEWTRFWEPFGADSYWKGPEFKTQAEPGLYEIRVQNAANHGKYVLAIGELEAFGPGEVLRTLKLVPQLKRDFFEETPFTFIRSPFGWGMILAIYVLVVIVGLLAHFAVRKLKKRKSLKLPAEHRLLLAGLGLCLLLWAMATTWNPIVIFVSGVCLFEASGISAILRRVK